MIRISQPDLIWPVDPVPWPAIHVPGGTDVSVQTLRGRLGQGGMVQIQLTGSGVRDYFEPISEISCRRISNGQPRMSLSGFQDAIVNPGGQLVKLEINEGGWNEDTGVIQVLDAAVGPGGPLVTEMTLVFWPCHTLWFYGLGEDDRQSVLQ